MEPLRVVRKSLWDSHRTSVIVITASGTITTANNSSPHLMVNQGVAFEAARQYPWLSVAASNCIQDCVVGYNAKSAVYGFVPVVNPDGDDDGRTIGLFQSKFDWKEPANLALIGFSAVQLMTWLNNNPNIKRVALNCPGLGLIGGLTEEQVLPILASILDRRVTVHIGSVLGE